MRYLLSILMLCSLAHGQSMFMGQNQPGVVASGQQFTETFGNWNNPAGLCWAAGPSGCQNLWTVVSTANSVASCPGTTTWATTGGKNCLKMTEVAATAGYLYSFGTYTPVPASTTADYFAYIYVTSQSVANFDTEPLLCISFDTGCATAIAKAQWAPTGGNLQILGQGSTVGARSGTVTLNAWHLIRLHIDSTAANCNLYVDTVAAGAFTCNTSIANYIIIGDATGNLDAITYYVGRVWGNSTVNGGFPPSTLTQAGSNTNGANITTTTLTADTKGGDGAWTFTAGVAGTAFTYSNAVAQSYPIPITVNNIQYSTTGNTVSYFYNPANTPNGLTYTFLSPYANCSCKFTFRYTLTDAVNGYTMGNLGETSFTDPLGFHFQNGAVYMNDASGTANSSNGASGGCTSNCLTWVSGQKFTTGTFWNGLGITYNSVLYTISSVQDSTHLTLTTAPGTQTGQTFQASRQAISLTANTDYILSYRLQQNGPFDVVIYDSTGKTQIGALERQTISTGSCTSLCLGRGCGGDTTFTGSGGFYFGPIVLDYVQARWPIP